MKNIATSVSAVLIVGVMMFGISAASAAKGSPINAIWDAIDALSERIDSIELLEGPEGSAGEDGADGMDGVEGSEGAEGAEGPQGPQGEPGPIGPQGEPGSASDHVFYQRTGVKVDVPPSAEKPGGLQAVAYCDAGDRIISGGYNTLRGGMDIVLNRPRPYFSPTPAWLVTVDNRDETDNWVIAFALCEDLNDDIPPVLPELPPGDEF